MQIILLYSKPPSNREKSYERITLLHAYGDSTEVQQILFFCASAKTKNLLEDKKTKNDKRQGETE